jgi:photosystem II stability/assembly factor-like uncharacterized protein
MTPQNPSAFRLARRNATLAAATLGLNAAFTLGGVNIWTTAGPLPERVTALAADPRQAGLLYAALFKSNGSGGVFRSTNHALTWSPTTLSGIVGALAAAPPDTVYAGGVNSGDFRSMDAGLTWQQIRSAHPSSRVTFIRIDPANPSIVYMGTAVTIVNVGSDPGGDLLRSTDGGLTWQSIQLGLDFGIVWDLAIDGRSPATLHAVKVSGYYVSNDSGTTWHRVANGLPSADVRALALDPVTPTTVYAAGTSGLYKSVDSGDTFSRTGAGLPAATIDVLVIRPEQPSRLFAGTRGSGVYSTVDGGGTWTPLNMGLPDLEITSLALDASGDSLHAGTASGVFDYQFDPATLVLSIDHPFRIRLSARDQRTGVAGTGVPVALGDRAGYFTIPELTLSSDSPEAFVKIVDGRAINGAWWVFHGALTDLEYTLTVTEEATGRVKTYFKPAGSPCGEFDTAAFGP